MNIIEILWNLGWDVISFNENGEYKIQLGKARKDYTDKQIEAGLITYDGLTSDICTVKVDDVSFNGFGNLYVGFTDVETNACVDAYEYKNMGSDELF